MSMKPVVNTHIAQRIHYCVDLTAEDESSVRAQKTSPKCQRDERKTLWGFTAL